MTLIKIFCLSSNVFMYSIFMYYKYHLGSLLEPCCNWVSSILMDKLCCDCTVCCWLLLMKRCCAYAGFYQQWYSISTDACFLQLRLKFDPNARIWQRRSFLQRWCVDMSIHQLPLMLTGTCPGCSFAMFYCLCSLSTFDDVIALVVLLLSFFLCVCHDNESSWYMVLVTWFLLPHCTIQYEYKWIYNSSKKKYSKKSVKKFS